MQETYETWVQPLGQEDPLEESMGTFSSILAWRLSWTEEPAGLQSMWLQRAGHKEATQRHAWWWRLCHYAAKNLV